MRDQLEAGHGAFCQARDVMRQARDLFAQNVSPELLTGAERRWRAAMDAATAVGAFSIPVAGVLAMVASDVYWSGLENQRHREREEYCQGVLDQMNASLAQGAQNMQDIIDQGGDAKDNTWEQRPAPPIPGITDPNLLNGGATGGGALGGVGSAGLGEDGGGAGGVGAGGGSGAGGSLSGSDGAGAAAGGVVLPGGEWVSEGFARPGALQDPPRYARLGDVEGVGLVGRPVNQTVTPNGLVGGYAPPSAVRAWEPGWDPAYKIPAGAVSAGRAASAGLLGGAVVGARSLLSGAGVAGALAARASAGAAGFANGGAAAAKGGAGFGPAGVVGVGAPAGGGDGEGKKRRGRAGARRGEPEEAGPVWDPAHGPGSADDGTVFEVDWDEWEPQR